MTLNKNIRLYGAVRIKMHVTKLLTLQVNLLYYKIYLTNITLSLFKLGLVKLAWVWLGLVRFNSVILSLRCSFCNAQDKTKPGNWSPDFSGVRLFLRTCRKFSVGHAGKTFRITERRRPADDTGEGSVSDFHTHGSYNYVEKLRERAVPSDGGQRSLIR